MLNPFDNYCVPVFQVKVREKHMGGTKVSGDVYYWVIHNHPAHTNNGTHDIIWIYSTLDRDFLSDARLCLWNRGAVMATLTAPSRKLSRVNGISVAIPAVRARSFGGRLRLYLNLFRFLTLVLAASQMSAIVPKASIPIAMVIIGASIYTAFKLLTPVSVRGALRNQALLASDLIFCALLVWLTGGIGSPFLLYTLSPVLAASFFYDAHMATTVAVASVLDILITQLVNPFYNLTSGPLEFSFFFIYIVAVSLAGSLPYLVNLNLQQRMQGEFVAEERQRLSRELHDGTVQVLTALNWQAQLIERDLDRRGISLPSVNRLLRLTRESHSEARESLQLLRDFTESGQLNLHLKNYIDRLRQDAGIQCSMNLLAKEPSLEPHVELQLLRICQEALNNIRKHAQATYVNLNMSATKNNLTITIEDNGQGFDLTSVPQQSTHHGHGLSVMEERAVSAGGSFKLSSCPGKGTMITVTVPLNR
jgi:signal transduction histidine kinase